MAKLDEENNDIKKKLDIKSFYIENLFNKKILEEQIDINKNDKELSLIIYNELKDHIQNIKDEKNKILKLIEKLTFLDLKDIISNIKHLYCSYKEYIIKVMQDEIANELFNEAAKNKKESKKSEKKKNINKKKKLKMNKTKKLRANLLNRTVCVPVVPINSNDSLIRIISNNSLSTYKSSNYQEEQLSISNEEDSKSISISQVDIQNINQINDEPSVQIVNNVINSNNNRHPPSNVDNNNVIDEVPLNNFNEKININKVPSSKMDNNNTIINKTPSLSLDKNNTTINEASEILDNNNIINNDSPSFPVDNNNIKNNETSSNMDNNNSIINNTPSLPVENNNIKIKINETSSSNVENNNSVINDTPSLPVDKINSKKNKENPTEINETPSLPMDNSNKKNNLDTPSNLDNNISSSNTSSFPYENDNRYNIPDAETSPFPYGKGLYKTLFNKIYKSNHSSKCQTIVINENNYRKVQELCFFPFVNNSKNNTNGTPCFSYNTFYDNMKFLFINNNFNNDNKKYEDFYNCLEEKINNYCSITKKNVSILNEYKFKYKNKFEEIIYDNLKNKFDLEFGVYGSFKTDLSIEGSDIDVYIIYKPLTNKDTNFGEELFNLLHNNEHKYDFTYTTKNITNASKPRITVKVDISKEIFKNPSLKVFDYYDESDFTKITIDFTISDNKQYSIDNNNSVEYIKNQLSEYPQLRNITLVLKRFLRNKKKNEFFEGGIRSFSLLVMELNLIKTYLKENPKKHIKISELLFQFLKRFTYFPFYSYGIGTDNYHYTLQFYNSNGMAYILNPLNGNNIAYNIKCTGADINNIFYDGYAIMLSKRDKNDYKDTLYALFSSSKN